MREYPVSGIVAQLAVDKGGQTVAEMLFGKHEGGGGAARHLGLEDGAAAGRPLFALVRPPIASHLASLSLALWFYPSCD
ncbi:MAG: hypothetical protein JWO67_4057 [Streptosporangiaceae bacterium]|nr:hypothetical protein [Streptosporangiaceae bacterium]